MEKLIEKANILIEALPYIRKFFGKTIVIKYGGHAMIEEQLKDSFAQDIVLMKYVGINPIIVHGGGPQIGKMMEALGKKPKFVKGIRVTDQETMDIVEMVLGGKINKEVVASINQHGGKTAGLSGRDGGLIKAKKLSMKALKEEDVVDMGMVGEVEAIDPTILQKLIEDGFIPVIAPIGAGPNGEAYNINADHVAGALAVALRAEKLILLTDVKGIFNDKGRLISTLSKKEIKRLIDKGIITEGMIPKVEACLYALEGGVAKTHIIDGRVSHALLLEVFTDKGVGTEIIAEMAE